MPAPACHQKRLRKRPDGRRRRRRGFWEEDRGRERREGWRGARINRRRLAASLSVFSLSTKSGGGKGSYRLSRSWAFRFVFAGHGITPKATAARGPPAGAFADAVGRRRAT